MKCCVVSNSNRPGISSRLVGFRAIPSLDQVSKPQLILYHSFNWHLKGCKSLCGYIFLFLLHTIFIRAMPKRIHKILFDLRVQKQTSCKKNDVSESPNYECTEFQLLKQKYSHASSLMAIGLVELGYIVGQIAALEIPPHRMQSWLKITTIVFASDSYILQLVQMSYLYHYDITLILCFRQSSEAG